VPSVAENEDLFGWALATGDPGPAATTAAAASASRARSAAAAR
jgi:hypothetical protein